jgi:hypothetical protein
MLFDYLRRERYLTSKEDGMIRTVFAVAVAALAVTAAFGASQAAPIAPLPTGVTSDAAAGNVTPVYYRYHRHYYHRHYYHRHYYHRYY